MWTTLNLKVSLKKERNWDICMGTLDIEFEGDWSIGLGDVRWRSHTHIHILTHTHTHTHTHIFSKTHF